MTLAVDNQALLCGARGSPFASGDGRSDRTCLHRSGVDHPVPLLPDFVTDRLLALRDRLLLDPRFHRFAFAMPGTRFVARRETRALFDICAGFVYTQILLACVRTGLFAHLKAGPLPVSVIAEKTGLTVDAADRLLRGAASLRLVGARSGGRYGLGALGAAVAGDPSIAAMVEHHATLYADLYDPVALLRAQKPATAMSAYWPYAEGAGAGALSAGDVATYTALMATSQVMIAREVLDAYDFKPHRCVLDVGGGDGTFLAALAAAVPHLTLQLFDLPPVADLARARIARSGLSARATATGGDFHHDALPGGADVVTLVRVLFDHDDATAHRILTRVHAALPQNGTLLIAEPMSGTPGAEAVGDAYFSFYLLAMGRGRSRRLEDFARLLGLAGFDTPRTIATRNPLLTRVIAVRPKNNL
jgi:demethylspheroidene O-methyltransferase